MPHGFQLDLAPRQRLPVQGDRLIQTSAHIRATDIVEREAGRGPLSQCIGSCANDHIGQTAGATDDRQCPVPHRVHRCQSAGLEPRGMKEDIGTRLQPVRGTFHVANTDSHALRIPIRHYLERALQCLVTLAHQGELHVFLHDFRQSLKDNVRHFLVGKPAQKSDQGRIGTHVQPKLPLCGGLAHPLASDRGPAEGAWQGWVTGRIPGAVINSVQDSCESRRALPQQPIEPATALGRHDLPGIGWADRCQSICAGDPRLQQRDPPIELHACSHFAAGQSELGGRLEREETLKGQIVNSKDRARSKARLCRQEQGQKACVTVIGVDDISAKSTGGSPHRQVLCSVAKDGKAHRIVGPFAAMLILVKSAGPGEKGRTINKPNREPAIGHTGEQEAHRTSHRQISEVNNLANSIFRTFQRFRIGWHHKMHINTASGEGGW